MRYAMGLDALAGLLLLAAWKLATPWAWAACGYGAFSCILLGAAYSGLGPGIFLKAGGRLHPVAYVALGPYLLANQAFFELLRRLPGEPAYSEVMPGLFLGRRLGLREAEGAPFHAVLDLTCEFHECAPLRDAPVYRCIPLLDGTAPSLDQLTDGVDFIERHLGDGPVLVHCAMGHGRSATFVIAYMLRARRMREVAAAEQVVRARRPRTRLSRVQRRRLEGLPRARRPR